MLIRTPILYAYHYWTIISFVYSFITGFVRFKELLIMVDTCQASTLFSQVSLIFFISIILEPILMK